MKQKYLTIIMVLALIFQAQHVLGQRSNPPENVRPGRSVTFGNGAQLVRQGDKVIVTGGGRHYVMSVKDAKPPPAEMKLTSCGVAKHYLDTQQRVTDRWRAVSLWWADHCLQ